MNRKKIYSLLTVTLLLTATTVSAAVHDVAITNFVFSPATLNVQPGDSVRWTNFDAAPHTATAVGGGFDSGNLNTGQSYTHAFTAEESLPYVCLYHSNMTAVITVGAGGGGGDSNWTELNSPTALPLNDVRFYNEQIGWAAGDAGVLRTTDGGQTWTAALLPDDAEAVFFVTESDGWVCGNDGMLQRSTDGGQTWQAQSSGVGEKLRDIYFADLQHGWAAGRDGILIHTTNGGQSWSPQASPAVDDLRGIHMLDNQRGWIVGSDGLILHTANGGQAWTVQLSVPGGEEDEFEAVFAWNDMHAWAVGGQGRIYHTHDGGQEWTPQTSGTAVALMDVFFTGADRGWMCGAGGFVAHAELSGHMWHPQTMPVIASYNAVWFVNENLGFVVTGDGRILKYEAQPSPVNPPRASALPQTVTLLPNYPNPFNPATTIEFSLPAAGHATLEVFDILGRNVATLLDGPLAAGQHRTQFHAVELSGGNYFYRLRASGQIRTGLMTLLK